MCRGVSARALLRRRVVRAIRPSWCVLRDREEVPPPCLASHGGLGEARAALTLLLPSPAAVSSPVRRVERVGEEVGQWPHTSAHAAAPARPREMCHSTPPRPTPPPLRSFFRGTTHMSSAALEHSPPPFPNLGEQRAALVVRQRERARLEDHRFELRVVERVAAVASPPRVVGAAVEHAPHHRERVARVLRLVGDVLDLCVVLLRFCCFFRACDDGRRARVARAPQFAQRRPSRGLGFV